MRAEGEHRREMCVMPPLHPLVSRWKLCWISTWFRISLCKMCLLRGGPPIPAFSLAVRMGPVPRSAHTGDRAHLQNVSHICSHKTNLSLLTKPALFLLSLQDLFPVWRNYVHPFSVPCRVPCMDISGERCISVPLKSFRVEILHWLGGFGAAVLLSASVLWASSGSWTGCHHKLLGCQALILLLKIFQCIWGSITLLQCSGMHLLVLLQLVHSPDRHLLSLQWVFLLCGMILLVPASSLSHVGGMAFPGPLCSILLVSAASLLSWSWYNCQLRLISTRKSIHTPSLTLQNLFYHTVHSTGVLHLVPRWALPTELPLPFWVSWGLWLGHNHVMPCRCCSAHHSFAELGDDGM